MSKHDNSAAWNDINGGLRGSTLLRIGALLSIPAALLNVGAEVLPHLADTMVTTAWLLWIAALALMGAGFMWVGIQLPCPESAWPSDAPCCCSSSPWWKAGI